MDAQRNGCRALLVGLALIVGGCGQSSPPPPVSGDGHSAAPAPVQSTAASENPAAGVAESPSAEGVAAPGPAAVPGSGPTAGTNLEGGKLASAAPAAAREPATAAELIRKIDLRKLGRISPKLVMDEGPTYVYYSSQSSIAGADAFYREELKSRGWKPLDKWQVSSAEYADRMYENDGYFVRISIGAGGEEGIVGVGLSSLGNCDFFALPRGDGSELVESSVPANVNFSTPRGIAETVTYCRAELPRLGWQEYSGMQEGVADVPHYKQLTFVRNALRLMVSIAKDPTNPAGPTRVGYLADTALPFDLPLAGQASGLRIDTVAKRAEYVTAASMSDVVAFYQKPPEKYGWKLRPDGSRIGEKGATLFVEDEPDFGFAIQIAPEASQSKVLFHRLTFKEKAQADEGAEKIAAQPAPAPAVVEAPTATPPTNPAEELTREIQSQVQAEMKKAGVDLKKLGVDLGGLLGDALPGGKPAGSPASEPAAAAPVRRTAPSESAEPLPEKLVTGCRIWYGDAKHELKHGVAFERKEFDRIIPVVVFCDQPLAMDKLQRLTAAGKDFSLFDALPREAEVSIEIRFGESSSSITSFVGGASINIRSSKIKSNYRAEGGRLRGVTSLPEPEEVFRKNFRFEAAFDLLLLARSDQPVAPAGELVRNDEYELPVPEDTTQVSLEKSNYRAMLTASLDAGLASVASFYRRELTAAGWREDASRSQLSESSARLAFHGAEGDLRVELKNANGATMIEVLRRNRAKAQADGMIPPAGKARLVLGNAGEGKLEILVDQKSYPVAPHAQRDDLSRATRLDVAPGMHRVRVKAGGSLAEEQELQVEEGSTWAIVGLPDGHFATQLY